MASSVASGDVASGLLPEIPVTRAMLEDEDFVLAAVRHYPELLADARGNDDKDFVRRAIAKNWRSAQFMALSLRHSWCFMESLLPCYGLTLAYAPLGLRRIRRSVLLAVQQNGLALQFASEELRDNPEVVLAAARQDPQAIFFAGADARANRDLALEVVARDGLTLQHFAKPLRDDPQVVAIAVAQNALSIMYASEARQRDWPRYVEALGDVPVVQRVPAILRDDAPFFLALLKRRPEAFAFAAEALRRDRAFALAAVEVNARVLYAEGFSWQGDREIMLKVLATCPLGIAKVHVDLLRDPTFMLTAMSRCTDPLSVLQHAHAALRSDLEFMQEAMRYCGAEALGAATVGLLHVRGTALSLVQADWRAMKFIPKVFREDSAIAQAALRGSADALQYMSSAMKADRAVVLEAVQRDGRAIRHTAFRGDRSVVLAAVRSNGLALQHCCHGQDRAVQLAAVRQNWRAYQHVRGFLGRELRLRPSAARAAKVEAAVAAEEATEEAAVAAEEATEEAAVAAEEATEEAADVMQDPRDAAIAALPIGADEGCVVSNLAGVRLTLGDLYGLTVREIAERIAEVQGLPTRSIRLVVEDIPTRTLADDEVPFPAVARRLVEAARRSGLERRLPRATLVATP